MCSLNPRQDLFASLLINSERKETHAAIVHVHWRREFQPCVLPLLPQGFARHRDILPSELVDCIEDIVELQDTTLKVVNSLVDRLTISDMQACIESRLAFASQACRDLGPVVECCRIATVMTCFLSFMDVWANALIPCKLSDLLRRRLEDSMTNAVWFQRRDLQVWLLLVGSGVTFLNQGHVHDLSQTWAVLLARFRLHCLSLPQLDLDRSCIHRALNDFIYFKDVQQRRLSVLGWSELDATLQSI